MKCLLISAHSDDESLFCSYIMHRLRPDVVIVTDGVQHQNKFNLKIEDRNKESINACNYFDLNIDFLHISDANFDEKECYEKFLDLSTDMVLLPAKQGGNPQHDLVSDIGTEVFKNKIILYYSTYRLNNLEPQGEMAINPTRVEKLIKPVLLDCYTSQLKINPHHFEAVKDKPEYLNLHQIPHING